MIYVTADTHFCHEAAIDFPNRKFETLDDMHKTIIQNWNAVVAKDDVIYILGDFVFGYKKQNLAKVCRALHGRKMLITGNHDKYTFAEYNSCGVSRVYEYPILFNNYMLLSHDPVLTLGEHGLLNVHGHTHGVDFAQRTSRHFCVCQDCHGMKPIPIQSIYERVGVL